MEEVKTLKEEYLVHHGVRGQKWGQRLYQYKDGSLTPLGRARANRLQKSYTSKRDEYEKLTGKKLKRKAAAKDTVKKGEDITKKKIRDLTDDELKNRIDRLKKEKELAGLQNETSGTGAKFVRKVGKDIINESLVSAGKTLLTDKLTKVGKEKLGLDDKHTKTALELLKDEANAAKYKRQIAEQKDWIEQHEKKKAATEKAKKTKAKNKKKNNKKSKGKLTDATSIYLDESGSIRYK